MTYIVTNTGIVPLSGSSISIIDDNATPGTSGDDFIATFTGGDTNGDNMLDLAETWTYTATRTAVAGQRTHTGKATLVTSAQTIVKTDAANYFGSAPAIDIKTRVNGQDADSTTGPVLVAGGNATFTYVLTNTGNVALNNIAVIDDNGTPGNIADDFRLLGNTGDTNTNGLLDLGETWTYTATRTVVAGQFSNIAKVTATDSISQLVSDTDPANYFGLTPTAAPDLLAAE